jgi:hypothetical protein
MSADTHKFGYAAKGTSVVLYRGNKLRSFQYFTATEWPGGLYFSPTLAGSRPGALSAVCWAAMVATVDVYRVLEQMTRRGWSLNGLHMPPAVHICVTLRHTQPGVAERFLADLRASVEEVVAQPAAGEGMAPVYGLAATIPFRGMVRDLLKKYLDLLYRP